MFLLSLFWPPPFSVSLSLSLSFSLSLSLSCSFLSCFLLVVLFRFLLVPCFLSFFLFLSSSLLFHERNNIKRFNCICLNQSFLSFFGFLSCCSLKSLFRILVFPDFQLCFLFNINVVGFKKHKLKNTNFWSKGGCIKTFFL